MSGTTDYEGNKMESGGNKPKWDEMSDLSLMDKYRILFEKKKNQEYRIPIGKIMKYGPPVFIFGVTGVCVYAFVLVLPYHYEDSGDYVLSCHRAFTAFVAVEMMVNWFCIRFVDSSYRPSPSAIADYHSIHTTTNVQHVHVNIPPTAETNTNSAFSEIKQRTSDSSDSNTETRQRTPDSSDSSTGKNDVKENIAVKTIRYPYWSWKPCMVCNWMRPPRSSHCPFCKKCFLKRDHHCYLVGACVGWRNYRHFLVFSFWATIAALYGTYHSISYFYTLIWPNMSFLDFVFVFSIIRWVLGFTTFHIASAMTFVTLLLFQLYEIPSFLKDHIEFARQGITSFEYTSVSKSVKITDRRPLSGKLRSIFGDYWAMNIFIPLHFVFPPHEDPLNWPHISVQRLTD